MLEGGGWQSQHAPLLFIPLWSSLASTMPSGVTDAPYKKLHTSHGSWPFKTKATAESWPFDIKLLGSSTLRFRKESNKAEIVHKYCWFLTSWVMPIRLLGKERPQCMLLVR